MTAEHRSGDRFSERIPRVGQGGGGAGGGSKADAPGHDRSDQSHKYFDCEENPFELFCPDGQKILGKAIQEKFEKNHKDQEKKPNLDNTEKVLEKQKSKASESRQNSKWTDIPSLGPSIGTLPRVDFY
jgi:hypothetical protein